MLCDCTLCKGSADYWFLAFYLINNFPALRFKFENKRHTFALECFHDYSEKVEFPRLLSESSAIFFLISHRNVQRPRG